MLTRTRSHVLFECICLWSVIVSVDLNVVPSVHFSWWLSNSISCLCCWPAQMEARREVNETLKCRNCDVPIRGGIFHHGIYFIWAGISSFIEKFAGWRPACSQFKISQTHFFRSKVENIYHLYGIRYTTSGSTTLVHLQHHDYTSAASLMGRQQTEISACLLNFTGLQPRTGCSCILGWLEIYANYCYNILARNGQGAYTRDSKLHTFTMHSHYSLHSHSLLPSACPDLGSWLSNFAHATHTLIKLQQILTS